MTRVVDYTPGGKPVTHGGAGTAYVAYGCRCDECTAANRRRVNRRRKERDPADAPTHGTFSTYSNWNCRCDLCSAAHSAEMAKQYASRLARVSDAPHGTRSAYTSWGCRCDLCRTESSRRERARYAAKKAAS